MQALTVFQCHCLCTAALAHQHRAGAAVALGAAFLGAGAARVLAQPVEHACAWRRRRSPRRCGRGGRSGSAARRSRRSPRMGVLTWDIPEPYAAAAICPYDRPDIRVCGSAYVRTRCDFDKIDLHLVRVLHTVITERSVSRAALKLASTQPAVSAQLKRLRALTGDALLVRSGTGLAPTATALSLVEPAATLLREAERLFGERTRRARLRRQRTATRHVPHRRQRLPRPAVPARAGGATASACAQRTHRAACRCRRTTTTAASLARGEVDLVIGNWLEPPGELHLGRLFTDEIVCLVGDDHPAAAQPARLERGALPGRRACGADAVARRRARRHRRAPGEPGSGAPDRGAQPALRADPADAGADARWC